MNRHLLEPVVVPLLSYQPVQRFDGHGHLLSVTAHSFPGNPPGLAVHTYAVQGEKLPRWRGHLVPAHDPGGWGLPEGAEHVGTVSAPLLSAEGRILSWAGAHVFIEPLDVEPVEGAAPLCPGCGKPVVAPLRNVVLGEPTGPRHAACSPGEVADDRPPA